MKNTPFLCPQINYPTIWKLSLNIDFFSHDRQKTFFVSISSKPHYRDSIYGSEQNGNHSNIECASIEGAWPIPISHYFLFRHCPKKSSEQTPLTDINDQTSDPLGCVVACGIWTALCKGERGKVEGMHVPCFRMADRRGGQVDPAKSSPYFKVRLKVQCSYLINPQMRYSHQFSQCRA